MSEIAKWFSNKSAFVTGATGFIGKLLVAKLLCDCPDIDTIYIIIRPKKGVSFEQRKSDYKSHIAFSHLNEINPNALEKIHIVEGDICEPNCGMSDSDRKLIAERVSIVFHSAADVRFDRRLVDAYHTNVNGTKNVLDFSSEFSNLLVFVLVSTAYSQPYDIGKLEERLYESSITPENMQRIIDNVDPDIIDILTPKLLELHPNTYGFTKNLVEQLVHNYSEKFPTAIARPPIVVSAWKEPLIGYTEGIHGINGWSLASGRGVLRSMHCDGELPCNIMPADIVTNGIIVLAYERGKCHQKRLTEQSETKHSLQTTEHNEGPMYFNITEENPLNWRLYVDVLLPNFLKFPFDLALWYPGGNFVSNRFIHFMNVVLFQIIPAILIDLLLILFRHPPILLRVQRLIASSLESLEYYMNNKFIFKAENYNAACGRLNKIDREIFYDRTEMDIDKFLHNGAIGTRLYLANEKTKDLPKARVLYRRLWFLDVTCKVLFVCLILKKLMTYFNISIY